MNIYGHGYTGNFIEALLYAGNMAEHGLATIGINAMGHGLVVRQRDRRARGERGSSAASASRPSTTRSPACGRAISNSDGLPDSGGDFWSSYLFHTRDGVRQSMLDHIQLVRILRAFGTGERQDALPQRRRPAGPRPRTEPCDVNGDGKPDVAGDFDGDGVPDVGGPERDLRHLGRVARRHPLGHPRRDRRVRHRGRARLGRRRAHRHRHPLVPGRRHRGGAAAHLGAARSSPSPPTERPACATDSKEDDRCTLCNAGRRSRSAG